MIIIMVKITLQVTVNAWVLFQVSLGAINRRVGAILLHIAAGCLVVSRRGSELIRTRYRYRGSFMGHSQLMVARHNDINGLV